MIHELRREILTCKQLPALNNFISFESFQWVKRKGVDLKK